MSLGVSNLAGANGVFAGVGLSTGGAVAAQNFLNALLGQGESPRSGGESFLADVKDAKNPDEKRALIDGFAEGFAAASQGSGASQGASGAQGSGGSQAADGAQAGQANQAGGTDGSQSGSSPQDLMTGFKEIADKIAESDLPKGAKNALLDGIAEMMSKLQAQSPASGGAQDGAGPCQQGGAGGAGASTASADENGASGETGNCGCGGQDGTSGPNGAARTADSAGGNGSGEVWSHEVKDGEATIRLGDKYTIKANEKDASWTVTNNETGKTTKVSGDPHVDANGDGKNDFDFKKDMTFKLDDGTKITVGTVPGGDNGATYSSSLTITNGNNAMQVTGLGDSHDGENNLEVTQSMQGNVVDQLTNDGSNTIYENGGAWATGGGHAVDQSYIDRAEAMAG